jgi:SAM-dependent methyltransferase
VADAMKLPYRDDYFDLVVSVNAFEHIPNPIVALHEALRVTKGGGVIYLTFDPVWTADSGNHFSHLVQEPWAHLICDTEEFCARMTRAGAEDYATQEFRMGMNRMPASLYRDDFPLELTALGASSFHIEKWTGCTRDEFVNHPNRFAAAKLLGCHPDDLLIRGFCFLVCK